MQKKQGKKGRKYGRNKIAAKQYASEGRLEKNKAKRVARHLRNKP